MTTSDSGQQRNNQPTKGSANVGGGGGSNSNSNISGNGNATATVMDGNGRCNGNTTIGKRLGKRILAQKRQDFDVAEGIHDELHDKYAVEIDNQNKEWMMVAPRGGWWSKDGDGEGDELNIVSREEWEKGEGKDGDGSSSVDFVNGGAEDKDKETE